jgi:hypothetical protein
MPKRYLFILSSNVAVADSKYFSAEMKSLHLVIVDSGKIRCVDNSAGFGKFKESSLSRSHAQSISLIEETLIPGM